MSTENDQDVTVEEKVDVSTLSEADRKFYEQFGRLPPKDRKVPARMNQGKKQYFDSGEYFGQNKATGGAAGVPVKGNPLLAKAQNKHAVRIQVKAGTPDTPAATEAAAPAKTEGGDQ